MPDAEEVGYPITPMKPTSQIPPTSSPEMPTQNPPSSPADAYALAMILAFTLLARVILGSTSSKSP